MCETRPAASPPVLSAGSLRPATPFVRILHTADWHVGKRLGRYDRMDDHRAVLAELRAIADEEAVDLVVVAGDLFDRPMPPIEALELVVATLRRLARPERPVVAIAGNHDSGPLFELLAPLLRPENVHLVGTVRPPAAGGLHRLATAAGPVHLAAFPFLRHGQAVDFLAPVESWSREYADLVRRLCRRYEEALLAPQDEAVTVLVAHLMVEGVKVGGHGLPRGERELHMGHGYATTPQAVPTGLSYVALGHVHAPQAAPTALAPAEYCGSLLELDFGEAGEEKRVVIVDVEPGRPARRRPRPLTAGRRLRRVDDTWERLLSRPELRDCYLDLGVRTAGPDPGLADRARDAFPYLVKVRAVYDRPDLPAAPRPAASWDEQYRDYHRQAHESEPAADLLAAFREIFDEARDAAS